MTGWQTPRAREPVRWLLALIAAALAIPGTARPAHAQDGARLLATAGVIQIDGAGGGGLAPWATIAGYGSRDAIGATLHETYLRLPDFQISAAGAAIGVHDRLELSYAYTQLFTGAAGGRLGLGRGTRIDTHAVGAKLRLYGHLVADQDRWMPQIAAGIVYKSTVQAAIARAVGAHGATGTDLYLAATKLFLAQSLLLDATLIGTCENQLGLLGFGNHGGTQLHAELAASAVYLLTRRIALGAELRTKPDRLAFAREEDAYDVFASYFPAKSLSVTLAYADLGTIARQGRQNGPYLSVAVGF